MASSNWGTVTEVIPQASYEIVGRVIPGLVVMLSLYVAAVGPDEAMSSLGSILQPPEESSGLSGWAGVLAIIVAYILAFVLSGIWEIPATLRRIVNREPERDVESLRFDFVNQRLPKAGAWLTKLYAETTLTQVLIIGWLVSLAINLHFLVIRRWVPFPTGGLVERVWLCVGLLVGILGAAVARSCIARTRDRTRDNLWDLLQEQLVIAESEQPAR